MTSNKFTINETDMRRLSVLADTIAERQPDISEQLFRKLDNAKVVADGSDGFISMETTATYRLNDGNVREATLVFAGQADIGLGRISVLTPLGVALLGASQDQGVSWKDRNGRIHEATVVEVGVAPGTDRKLAA